MFKESNEEVADFLEEAWYWAVDPIKENPGYFAKFVFLIGVAVLAIAIVQFELNLLVVGIAFGAFLFSLCLAILSWLGRRNSKG